MSKTKAINWYHADVLKGLRHLLKIERDKFKKMFITQIINDMEKGNASAQQQLWAAKMLGLRNPEFDDDYIGRWDDDDE